MLNKLFSKLKPSQTTTHSPAEAAMLATLASPEKTALLISQLEAARDSEPDYSARRRHHETRLQHARLALTRHQLETERQRVASVLKRDQANAEKALQAANEAHATATQDLELHESKHLAVVKRLAPLETELLVLQQTLVKRAEDAQIEFDKAIALDNAEAESRAAIKLFEAKKSCESGSISSGPLGLRIAALQCEISTNTDAVVSNQGAVDQAAQDRLEAQAQLALVAYDRQSQALLEAYLAQRIAVNAAHAHQKPSEPTQKVFGNVKVDEFESQVSSSERIVFGERMDARSNRHLSSYITDNLCKALEFKPNLSLLIAPHEDSPAGPLEPSESNDPEAEKVAEDTL